MTDSTLHDCVHKKEPIIHISLPLFLKKRKGEREWGEKEREIEGGGGGGGREKK